MTRIDPDGTLHRRMVDTARQSDHQLWEDLAARAVGVPVPYRPVPGIAVYHISVDDMVAIAAEHDLAGPLRDLVTAVMVLGEMLGQSVPLDLRQAFPQATSSSGTGGPRRAAPRCGPSAASAPALPRPQSR